MNKEYILSTLARLVEEKAVEVLRDMLPTNGMLEDTTITEQFKLPVMPNPNVFSKPHPFQRRIGRIAIVNRIRNGSLQMNRKVDVMGKGYRLMSNGQVIKMSPKEVITRRRAAKIAARKRQIEMAQIVRKRMLSIRRRNSELGYM